MRWAVNQTRKFVRKLGVDIVPFDKTLGLADAERAIVDHVQPYTMAGTSRICALIDAVNYIVAASIPGSIVECGVWRGGSIMAVAETLLLRGNADRELFLFDTYEGMTEPGQHDVARSGHRASEIFVRKQSGADRSKWCLASLPEVKRNLATTNYDQGRCHFIKGKVEETLPEHAPDQIALLRLDTDWYESTRHELEHLFPLLSPGGVLIIDDYGYWKGSRRAVDEYFAEHDTPLLLQRIDHSARIAIKPRLEDAPPKCSELPEHSRDDQE